MLADPSLARMSPSRLRWQMLRIALFGGGLAVVAGTVLFFFGLDLTRRQMQIGGLYVVVPTLLVMSTAVVWVVQRSLAPVLQFLAQAPGTASGEQSRTALVRALNLPIFTLLRITLLQIPLFGGLSTLLMLWCNHRLGLGFTNGQIGIAWLAVLFTGTGHAIVEYFVTAAALQPLVRLTQAHCGELTAEVQRRLIPVSMRRKFLAVAAFAVFTPMVVLGFTTLLKADRLLVQLGIDEPEKLITPLRNWVVLLVVGSAALSLFMAVVMAREVMHSTATMLRAMEKVKGNRLDTELVATTTDEFAALYDGFNRMTAGLRERERLRDGLGRYVAPSIADEVMRHGIRMGGEPVQASVLFADIRGFTAMSERMTPQEVVELLNGYFAAVEPAIVETGGWINKFGGDSLLAVFGAPESLDDHALRAVRAALAMRPALAEFNERQVERGKPEVAIGIGIASGELVAGSVGSPRRMEYTVIGDVVNLAARLEEMTKHVQTDCLITAPVYEALGEAVRVEALPDVEVAGKADRVAVYAVL